MLLRRTRLCLELARNKAIMSALHRSALHMSVLFTASHLLLVLFVVVFVSGTDAFTNIAPPSSAFSMEGRRWRGPHVGIGGGFVPRDNNCHVYFPSVELKATNGNNNNNSKEEVNAIARATQLITTTPKSKLLTFSAIMTFCGAALGPFLDSYHSLFGVLSYEQPLTAHLWGSGSPKTPDLPALVTAWWVPELFGLAGFIIGWLYILLDAALDTPSHRRDPSWPLILVGISFFTAQYWLSGVMYADHVDRTTILNVMSVLAALGFAALDLTEAGFYTSLATAIGGPAIECGLITVLVGHGGYHYNDLGDGLLPAVDIARLLSRWARCREFGQRLLEDSTRR